MENNSINTDNAACGFTDISGVKKNTPCTAPEQRMEEKRHDADDVKCGGGFSAVETGAEVGGRGETNPSLSNKAEVLDDSAEQKRFVVSDKAEVLDDSAEQKRFVVSDKAEVLDGGETRNESMLSDKIKILDGGVGQTKPVLSDWTEAEENRADSSAEAHNCVNSAGEGSEAEKEDKEFLALIKGRYREAYRRRTESIIRRRLKSVRTKADSDSASVSEMQGAVRTADGVSDLSREGSAVGRNITDIVSGVDYGASDVCGALNTGNNDPVGGVFGGAQIKERAEIQKNANRSRPRENGVGGSVGMITGINVSALKGSDVLELLRRAEAGEKIKFK